MIPSVAKSKLASTAVITAILILSMLSILVNPAQAVTPSIVKYSIPVGANPLSLAADESSIYYASNTNGNVFKVDPATGSYTTLSITGDHNWASSYYYRKALWLVDANGGLYSYNLTTSAFGLVAFQNVANDIKSSRGQMLVAGQCPVGDYNFTAGICARWNSLTKTFRAVGSQNFWYTAHQYSGLDLNGGISSGARFDKIEYLRDVSLGNPDQYYNFPYDCSSNPVLCAGVGPYEGFAQDKYGDVLFTDNGSGSLFIYNATQNSMSRYPGFTSPAGIAVNGYNAYIAQNMPNGGIVTFNLQSHSITATTPTSGSSPFGVAILAGEVVWGSTDGTICVLNGVCAATGEANYYLLPLANGGLAFGYVGSSGVGIASGLVGGSTTTTTTTSGSGNLPSYAPQVVPSIHLNSTGISGQYNIYLARNNSVTLTGFEWFEQNGAGTFGCLIVDNGLCVTSFGSPSPSSGTFQSFIWTTPPTMEGPQPVCTIVPYLSFCHLAYAPVNTIQTSITKYGIFCNNAYIVNTARQCNGNGIPISYQTFSITMSNLPLSQTVITLRATGTASNGQYFQSNIFVYNLGT